MSPAPLKTDWIQVASAAKTDRNQMDRLLKAHLWVVKRRVAQYKGMSHYDDLYQEGMLGLMKAAEKFDASKGFQFSTYAGWWVRQKVQRAAWGDFKKRAKSLDDSVGEDSETALLDTVPDPKALAAFDLDGVVQDGQEAKSVLMLLTVKESRAMELRFGVTVPAKEENEGGKRMRALQAKCRRRMAA